MTTKTPQAGEGLKFRWLEELRGADLTAGQYRVLVNLFTYADGETLGSAYPATRTLAQDCQMSRSATKAALRILRERGFIVLERVGGNSEDQYREANSWRLTLASARQGGGSQTPSEGTKGAVDEPLARTEGGGQQAVRGSSAGRKGAVHRPPSVHRSGPSSSPRSIERTAHDSTGSHDDARIDEAARRVAAVDAGKDWQAPGIAKYLRALVAQGMALADAEAQAVRAASASDARTPAAIEWDRFKAAPPAATGPSGPTCRACGKTRMGHDRNRDNTGDPHKWEPVGGEASTGGPNPQEEQVGQVEKRAVDEPLPEEAQGTGSEPAKPTTEPSAPPPADLPAQPATDTQPKTPDPAEGQQKPSGVSEGVWAAASAGEARGASHRTSTKHEAAA